MTIVAAIIIDKDDGRDDDSGSGDEADAMMPAGCNGSDSGNKEDDESGGADD